MAELKARVSERERGRRRRAEDPAKAREAGRRYMAKRRKDPEFRAKASAYHKEWYAARRDDPEFKTRVKDARLRAEYGLEPSVVKAMLDSQGQSCAICGSNEPRSKKGWQIDHCHNTGVVRGILCLRCNTALGKFADDPELLMKAAMYIEAKGSL